tara:strand:- start:121 stop:336 length:216 start_codon:yes stop_codon:yes gene_type:complete
MSRRFAKAKEFVQSDTFGNVVDFFQSQGTIGSSQSKSPPVQQQQQQRPPKEDYTPLYIMGAIALLVALIKK